MQNTKLEGVESSDHYRLTASATWPEENGPVRSGPGQRQKKKERMEPGHRDGHEVY